MIGFMWAIFAILLATAFYIWMWPFLKTKFHLWRLALKLQRMARKHPEMKEIAKTAKELAKDFKIDDKL